MTWLATITLAAALIFLFASGGGIFPWTVCVAAVLTAGAHLVCGRTGKNPALARYRKIEAVYIAVIAFVLLTLVPLPTPLTVIAGKLRYEQNRCVTEAIGEAVRLGLLPDKSACFPLTRNCAGTMRATVLLVACFSCLFLASALTEKQKRGFLYLLFLSGGVLAVAGYVALRIRPQGDTLWWTIPIPHGLPGPLVCFANRNHFAGYLAMLCPVALGLSFSGIARCRRGHPVHHVLAGVAGAVFCLLMFAAMTVAVALTLSRGAVVAYAGGHLVLLAIYLVRRRWIRAASLAIAGCAVVAALISLPNAGFRERMDALRSPVSGGEFKERIDAWRTCITIWRSYPVAGAGLNAFRMAFPQHRTTSRREFMTYPENEYAQLPAESGLIGTGLFVLFIVAVLRCRIRDGDSAVSAPLLAGLATVAIHACFDFAPHLPVYAMTVATMLGFLAGRPDRGLLLRFPTASFLNRQAWPSMLALVLVGILSLHAHSMRVMDSPGRMADLGIRRLAVAMQWSPVSWQTWFYFGRECCRDRQRESKLLGERCITEAARLDPNNYLLWRELGHLRLKLGMTDKARTAFARTKELRYWVDVPDIPE